MTALQPLQLEFGYGPARVARLESERALSRALPASFLFVTGLLLALAIAQHFAPPSTIEVDLGPASSHRMIEPGVIPPDAGSGVLAPAPPVPGLSRVPLPVVDAVAPAVEATGGVPPGAGLEPGRQATGMDDGSGEVSPGPEPGTFVYTDQLPARTFFVAPSYSDMARDAGVEGTVMVWALVDLDGSVKGVRVLRSVPLLDEAASSAVRQWRFTPALANGHPVRVWVAVPVKFTLH